MAPKKQKGGKVFPSRTSGLSRLEGETQSELADALFRTAEVAGVVVPGLAMISGTRKVESYTSMPWVCSP